MSKETPVFPNMPRRPRPTSRQRPQRGSLTGGVQPSTRDTNSKLQRTQRPILRETGNRSSSGSSAESAESSGSEEDASASSSHSDHATDVEDGMEYVDVDAPRVAQYVDEDELDGDEEEQSAAESDSDEDEAPHHMTAAQLDDFASLPFGALRKAQIALSRANDLGEEAEEDSSDEDEEGHIAHPDTPHSEPSENSKSTQEIPKRRNKHAPQEVSSKKPVARKKLANEGEKVVPRDPRFLPITGEFSSKRFKSQYGFLADMHLQEKSTLRENLKRARKLLANSPRDIREEREQEVQRLERAFKRAESMVSKDKREKIEQEALDKVGKEEKEKRKTGKGAWYMKDADKKDLLLRAKYEALAASGGRGAVRKAIEKKQKKTSQKEKKSRPFPAGRPAGPSRKRAFGGSGDDGQRSEKRRRVVS